MKKHLERNESKRPSAMTTESSRSMPWPIEHFGDWSAVSTEDACDEQEWTATGFVSNPLNDTSAPRDELIATIPDPTFEAQVADESSGVHAIPDSATGDPLTELPHLKRVAVLGASRLRELASQPVDWVWKDYVAASTIALIAGPPAGGKTTALFLILLARASTGAEPIDLFGRLVKPASMGRYVVLVEGEHGAASASRKLVRSSELMKLGDEALDRIILVARSGLTIGSPEWKDVETLIERGKVSDVAIDTLARVAPGDANNEEKQAQIFSRVAAAIEKAPLNAQPTIWVIAHTRKGGSNDLEDVSGSAQRVGQADTVIMIQPERDKGNSAVVGSRISLLKAREEVDQHPDPVVLRIAEDRFEVTSSTKGSNADVKPSDVERVKAHILAQGEVGSSKQNAADLGMRPQTVYAAMKQLAKEGVVVSRPLDKNGRSTGWDLA